MSIRRAGEASVVVRAPTSKSHSSLPGRSYLRSRYPHDERAVHDRISSHMAQLEQLSRRFGVPPRATVLSSEHVQVVQRALHGHLEVLPTEVLQAMVECERSVNAVIEHEWVPREKTRQLALERLKAQHRAKAALSQDLVKQAMVALVPIGSSEEGNKVTAQVDQPESSRWEGVPIPLGQVVDRDSEQVEGTEPTPSQGQVINDEPPVRALVVESSREIETNGGSALTAVVMNDEPLQSAASTEAHRVESDDDSADQDDRLGNAGLGTQTADGGVGSRTGDLVGESTSSVRHVGTVQAHQTMRVVSVSSTTIERPHEGGPVDKEPMGPTEKPTGSAAASQDPDWLPEAGASPTSDDAAAPFARDRVGDTGAAAFETLETHALLAIRDSPVIQVEPVVQAASSAGGDASDEEVDDYEMVDLESLSSQARSRADQAEGKDAPHTDQLEHVHSRRSSEFSASLVASSELSFQTSIPSLEESVEAASELLDATEVRGGWACSFLSGGLDLQTVS